MLAVLPFLGLLVLVYALTALFGPADMASWLAQEMFRIDNLPSTSAEQPWLISAGDLFVIAALAMLALETLKATNTTKISLGNHGLSALVLIACLVLFLIAPGFGTTTFFLITAMALFDTVVGMVITIITARRDLGVPGLSG